MKTLKQLGFKDEEIASWREIPITRAVVACLKELRGEAEQAALEFMRGDYTDAGTAKARVMSGAAEGVSKSIYFIENGGK